MYTIHLLSNFPSLMVVYIIDFCMLWINSLPPKGGILDLYAPQTLLLGTHLDFNTLCHTQFITYSKTY